METISNGLKAAENRLLRFVKDWTLPLAMLAGMAAYFLYTGIPGHEAANRVVGSFIAVVQPTLIFLMLFVTFCKVRVSELRLCRWHLWLMLFQLATFSSLAIASAFLPESDTRVIVESAMLCLICPTATAAAVITGKLGGNAASLVSYTIISNLTAATAIPLLLPFSHPHAGLSFLPSLGLILLKVFPLLICPLAAACLVRRYCPALHGRILRYKDAAFYLWVVALALAIGVTTKSVVHSTVGLGCQAGIAAVSLFCCLLQFGIGKRLGRRYGETISAGQALGQKNTVFAIWLGYTFLTPVTAIAGGFYSIWHNVINSLQLYRQRKAQG